MKPRFPHVGADRSAPGTGWPPEDILQDLPTWREDRARCCCLPGKADTAGAAPPEAVHRDHPEVM
jgi:hypothetical protein